MGGQHYWRASWVVLLGIAVFVSEPAAGYSGGSGSEADPFQIVNPEDWVLLYNTAADWNKHFVVARDINLSGATLKPVGSPSKPFTGTLDGRGHVLRNAQVNQPGNDFVGLFGYIGPGGAVRNLGVDAVAVTGAWHVGGFAGFCVGSIASCFTTGGVTGAGNHVGGFVGSNGYHASITACHATGETHGGHHVGGFAGSNSGNISACYAAGLVTGTSEHIGGFVGLNSMGYVGNCYARGAASGGQSVGGFVGAVTGGALNYCYAVGAVTGSGNLGGFVALKYSGTITACYWDKNTTTRPSSDGGEGRTTEEMTWPHAENTYVDWDFQSAWLPDTNHSVNDGYPYLGVEEAGCGCCGTSGKNLPPGQWLQHRLGDILLIGLVMAVLLVTSIHAGSLEKIKKQGS